MYREAITAIKRHLLMHSEPSNLLYIRELPYGLSSSPSDKMDHLVCFLPAVMALIATDGRLIKEKDRKKLLLPWQQEDLYMAEELTRSCYEMYHQTPTGLASEIVVWNPAAKNLSIKDTMFDSFRAKKTNHSDLPPPTAKPSPDGKYMQDFHIKPLDRHNLLRPETVESLFTLYRVTGDEKYREWGWNIFKSFERWSRVESGGYTSLVSCFCLFVFVISYIIMLVVFCVLLLQLLIYNQNSFLFFFVYV
jgi:mannosyl-oligosaccharide alpha-1,2-mannosidase